MTAQKNPEPATKLAEYITGHWFIFLIWIFHLLNNLLWLLKNRFPTGQDEPSHLAISLRFHELFSGGLMHFLSRYSLKLSEGWPPLYHITAALLNFLTGTSYVSSVMANMLYLLILLFSIYYIAVRLSDRRTGIISVMLLSLYPMIFRYSRFFGTDFPLTAAVALTVCLLLYTENFSNRVFSVWAGLAMGLGMLIKYSFALYTAVPFIYILMVMRKTEEKERSGRMMNILLACLIAGAVAIPWYYRGYHVLLKRGLLFFSQPLPFDSGITSRVSSNPFLDFPSILKQHLLSLINEHTSPLLFMSLIISCVWFLKEISRKKFLLILWYMFPLFLFSLPSQREARFMLPAVPALAIMTAMGLSAIRSRKARALVIYPIVILGMIQYYIISFSRHGTGTLGPVSTPAGDIYPVSSMDSLNLLRTDGQPFREEWRIDDIALSIIENCRFLARTNIGVICTEDDTLKIFGDGIVLDYYLLKNGFRDFSIVNFSKREIFHFLKELSTMDCIVFISSDGRPGYDVLRRLLNKYLTSWQIMLERIPIEDFPMDIPEEQAVDTVFIEEACRRIQDFIHDLDRRFVPVAAIDLPGGRKAEIMRIDECLISSGRVNAAFMDGRLDIWYDNSRITSPGGIETVFRIKDRDFRSPEAEWTIKKVSYGTLIGEATWPDLPGLLQRWELDVRNDAIISRIKLDSTLDKEVHRMEVNASISGEYSKYHDAQSVKGLGGAGWMEKGGISTAYLPYSALETTGKLPGLVFYSANGHMESALRREPDRHKTHVNSLLMGRAAIRPGKSWSQDFTLKFFPEGRSGWAEMVKGINKRYVIKENGTSALFFKGKLLIYRRGECITPEGFFTELVTENGNYYSRDAVWDIGIVSDKELHATGRWLEDVPFEQSFSFLLDDGRISCRTGLLYPGKGDMPGRAQFRTVLSLDNSYSLFFDLYGKGPVPENSSGGIILTDTLQQVLGLSGRGGKKEVPDVLFMEKSRGKTLAQVHYSQIDRRLLFIRRINESKTNICTEIMLRDTDARDGLDKMIKDLKAEHILYKQASERALSLNLEKTRVSFDSGQGRIFYKDREITGGFGIYSSVLINGIWHDSRNAFWDTRIHDGTIEASGAWEGADIMQRWKIRLEEEGTLFWKADVSSRENISADEIQFSVMLGPSRLERSDGGLGAILESDKDILRLSFDHTGAAEKKASKADFMRSDANILTYYYSHVRCGKSIFQGHIRLKED